MGGDDEAVLVDAGDAGEFFEEGGREAFLEEGGDERGVFEPQAKAVGEDVQAAGGVEGAEFGGERRWGWAEGLVELLLLLRGVR